MTGDDVIRHIRDQTPLNAVRSLFASWCGRIEQRAAQRTSFSPVELRAMEFDAIREIGEAWARLSEAERKERQGG